MTGNEKSINEAKKLILTDREKLELSGVLDVVSFDEEHALCEYIHFYNNERIQLKTKLTPLEKRSQYIA